MNLGSLVTIANEAPKNFIHFLCENGSYEANGGHPIPGAGVVSFADIAKAAGYPRTYEFSDLEVFESEIGRILQEEGPIFVDLKVQQGERYPVDYDNLHSAERRRAFKEALDAIR